MKIHLLKSVTPLTEGEDLTAICSRLVPKAHWIFQGPDGDKIEDWRKICRDCKEAFVPVIGHTYLYGAIAGEEWEQIRRKEAE